MKEREIRLHDLIVEILLKWRVIIVWMLVGGILMGAVGYIRSGQAVEAQENQSENLEKLVVDWRGKSEAKGNNEQKIWEYFEDLLTETQISNVDTAVNYENFYREKELYLQEAILMQVDASKMPRAKLTFLILAEDEEKTKQIERIYEDLIPDGVSQWQAERQNDDASANVLNQVVVLDRNSRDLEAGSDSFSIVIYHITEEQCLALVEDVKLYFQEQCLRLTASVGEHDIRLINETFSFVSNSNLADSKKSVQNEIMNWKASAARLKEAFSEEEWQYYNYLAGGKLPGVSDKCQLRDEGQDMEELPGSIEIDHPSVSKKEVLVGMIFFAFLYVFYVFLKYILDRKLRSTDNVTFMYGVPDLGVVSADINGKKPFAVVDEWILKLRNWNKRKFDREETIGLAAIAVKMAAKKEDLKEIYCMGCNLNADMLKIADGIQKVLNEADISMKVLNNVLYDQEIMELLLSARGVFLLERAGGTYYDEISRELELLHRQEIKVLGIIVAE